jgi:hypothetical protein
MITFSATATSPARRRGWSASSWSFDLFCGAVPAAPGPNTATCCAPDAKHKVDRRLVNSGWTGGTTAWAARRSSDARARHRCADGSLRNASYRTDPYFGSVPTSVPGVEPHLFIR